MRYSIYDQDGNTRLISCPKYMIRKQLRRGESYIEGTIDQQTQKIINGQIVNKTQAEIAAEQAALNPIIPSNEQIVTIKQKDWHAVMNRLAALENP